MKKSDKKIENSLRLALKEVCEIALDEVVGFKWLTHLVDYSRFPASLSVVCVFDTQHDLSSALGAHKDDYLYRLINDKLSAAGVQLKNIRQHVRFDTEEACEHEHQGKWQVRLK